MTKRHLDRFLELFEDRKIQILGAAAAVLLIAIGISLFRGQKGYKFPKNTKGACPGPTEEFVMNDVYMKGIIELGQKVKVETNYYACHPIQNGDIVMYYQNPEGEPIVKIVRAVPGDSFELTKDIKYKAWNIKINGDYLMDSVEKRKYFFGAATPPTLSLYVKARDGVLRDEEVLLFSSWAPGDQDSGIFGIYKVGDLVGRVLVN